MTASRNLTRDVTCSHPLRTRTSLALPAGWYGAFAPPGQRSVVDTWGRLAIRRGYATTANGGGGTGRATRKERNLKNFTNEANR